MSQIDDYGCDRQGCDRVADELIETDDGDRVLLCRRCYEAGERGEVLQMDTGRLLMQDTAGSWFFLPEREGAR